MVSSIYYNGDGSTRIFPVSFKILGDDYIRVYVDDVELVDKTKYDIINNSVVFTTSETPAVGVDNVKIFVATSSSELGDLGAPLFDITSVANNIQEIIDVSGRLNTIESVNDNEANINLVATSTPNINTVANDMPNVNTVAGWVDSGFPIVETDDAFVVETVEELSVIIEGYKVAIVKDLNRGGTFIWSATGTANGGTIFAGASGYWNRQYSGAINVRWFGALGAGADEIVELQNAVDSAPVGSVIVFPETSYRVSKPLIINKGRITLEGLVRVTRDNLSGTCTLYSTSTTEPALHILGTTEGGDYDGTLEDTTIRRMMFSRVSMGVEGSITVKVENAIFTTFEESGASFSQTGLYAKNVNGLRLSYYHATVGGDLASNVYGVYIDGQGQASTGILINDFIFYGGSTPSGTSYAYYDYSTTGSSVTGDRRFINLEVTGDTNYGLWIEDNGGFSSDIYLGEFTADSIKNRFLTVRSPNPYAWQQLAVIGGWINLTNASGDAAGVYIEGRKNTNLTNITVVNSGSSSNNGFWLRGFTDSTLTGCQKNGNASTSLLMQFDSSTNVCTNSSITGFVANGSSPIYLYDTEYCSFASIAAKDTSINFDATCHHNSVTGSQYMFLNNAGVKNGSPNMPFYEDANEVFAYNTVCQVSHDILLIVNASGDYINGIQILTGNTTTPTRVVAWAGDNANVATVKRVTLTALIPAGTYFKVETYGEYSFETITITGYRLG